MFFADRGSVASILTGSLVLALFLASPIQAQQFGSQNVMTTNADGARSVHARDLDGDLDADVLFASGGDDKIAWYENQGGGTFSSQKVITTEVHAVVSVYARDLDGDSDADVLFHR
jgi:hypothetical protein